ncbi:MAG: AraC family transcriptional regulator [Pseudomonadota bacterium]
MADQDEIIDAETVENLASQMNYEHSFEELNGTDQKPDAQAFEGNISVYQSSFGASLSVSDVSPLSDQKHSGIVPRSFNVLYLRCGNMEARADLPFDSPILNPGQTASISICENRMMATTMFAGQRTQAVNIHAQPENILDEELAAKVFDATTTDRAETRVLSARLKALADDIFSGDYEGHMGQLLVESFAFELFARSLQHRIQGNTSNSKLDLESSKKMSAVRDVLISEPGAPHTLASLANTAGVSVSSLKSKFPLLTGQPVFQFLRDTRLEIAYIKIQQDGWSVASAAKFVGYAHPENFSAAFRKRFGISPSAIR